MERPEIKEVMNARELDLTRQWFDAVQDIHPGYLQHDDFALAKKIYDQLGMRVPDSIMKGLL